MREARELQPQVGQESVVTVAAQVEVVQRRDSVEAVVERGTVDVEARRGRLNVASQIEEVLGRPRQLLIRDQLPDTRIEHSGLDLFGGNERERPEDPEVVPAHDRTEIWYGPQGAQRASRFGIRAARAFKWSSAADRGDELDV